MKVKMEEANELLVDDLELLLREITEFSNATVTKPEEIPQTLENYLLFVARTGNPVFPWQHIRLLFRVKMMAAINQFGGEACPSESFVLERFDLFRAAPFTIQRFTELITVPTRHYKKKEKFLRGLEKTVLVVSTVEPKPVHDELKNGNDNSNSSADVDTDHGFSEGDDQPQHRTFSLDQHDDLVTSASSGRELGNGLDAVVDTMSSSNLNTIKSHVEGSGALLTESTVAVIAGSSSTPTSSGESHHHTQSLHAVNAINESVLHSDHKGTEIYHSFVEVSADADISPSASSPSTNSSQILLDSNTIINVGAVPSEPHVLHDSLAAHSTAFTEQGNMLVEISSTEQGYDSTSINISLKNSNEAEMTAIVDENGNPEREMCEAVPKVNSLEEVDAENSTPMDVDDEEVDTSTAVFSTDCEAMSNPILPPATTVEEREVETEVMLEPIEDVGRILSSEDTIEKVSTGEVKQLDNDLGGTFGSRTETPTISISVGLVSSEEEYTVLKSQRNIDTSSSTEVFGCTNQNDAQLVQVEPHVEDDRSAMVYNLDDNFAVSSKIQSSGDYSLPVCPSREVLENVESEVGGDEAVIVGSMSDETENDLVEN